MYITYGKVFGGTPNICMFWLFPENGSISERTVNRALKVLGHSVGLCKTTKRKGKLFIILLVDVWRIICENFNPIRLILAEI